MNAVQKIEPAIGVQARVWVAARHFFRRANAQNRCWLWLLDGAGRVHALHMNAKLLGRDDLLPSLVRHLSAAPDEPSGNLHDAWPLPNAPVVPVPRWSVTWGHPLQSAIRDFAARLDDDVLMVLGRLEAPGPYFGSVANYNALSVLPPPVRARRIQALGLFPPLVAPILLDGPRQPDMFGDAEDDLHWSATVEPLVNYPVLEAMDHGRDLIGALAAFHRVDRALVRLPTFREPWQQGRPSAPLLRLLAAMPPPQRPRTCAALEQSLSMLDALPFDWKQPADTARLAHAFSGGWEHTWQHVAQAHPNLHNALADTRDFLRAALEQADLPAELAGLDAHVLGVAWMARRGLSSLLAASTRWHARPLQELPAPPLPLADSVPNDPDPDAVETIFGTWQCAEGRAAECTTRAMLRAEGDAMHHCVGGYWQHCRLNACRIVHLRLADGSQATAQYDCTTLEPDPQFALTMLRGPFNADCSPAMRRFAGHVTTRINTDENRQALQRVLAQAGQRRRASAACPPPRGRTIRRLDNRSRTELAQVLAYCRQQPDWIARWQNLYCGHIAGFAHGEGGPHLHHMHAGDALQLVREPANPHDPLAVRMDWRGHKLGYVPRHENIDIAHRLDAGQLLHAEILDIQKQHEWTPVQCLIGLPP